MSVFDSFPPKNLSPESTAWGREVETRIFKLASGNQSGDQALTGLNRTTAATLETLASQIRTLAEQVENLNTQVARVDAAYQALPVPIQAGTSTSNFAVSSSGSWNTVASVTLVMPKSGRLRLSASGSGMLRSPSTSTNMEASARLTLDETTSASIPGNFESPDGIWRNSFFVPWGWDVPITEGQTLRLSLQINPNDAASWPGGTGSYAVLSAIGAVSGS